MQDWQQRVVDEHKELAARRDKLAEFINAPSQRFPEERPSTFDTLPQAERTRMYRQLSIMNQYVRILDERIEAFGV